MCTMKHSNCVHHGESNQKKNTAELDDEKRQKKKKNQGKAMCGMYNVMTQSIKNVTKVT